MWPPRSSRLLPLHLGVLFGIIPQVILSEELDYSKGGISENVLEPANWVVVLNGCCCQFGVQKVSVLL